MLFNSLLLTAWQRSLRIWAFVPLASLLVLVLSLSLVVSSPPLPAACRCCSATPTSSSLSPAGPSAANSSAIKPLAPCQIVLVRLSDWWWPRPPPLTETLLRSFAKHCKLQSLASGPEHIQLLVSVYLCQKHYGESFSSLVTYCNIRINLIPES